MDAELMFRPAIELAGMVRAGEISAAELVGVSLARIEALEPQLNAFVEVDGERALAAARAIAPGDERPFAGVPMAIKNNRPVKGLRLTNGCALMSGYVADYDHSVVARLRGAGFVIVGTTTLPEYAVLPTSEARLFGPTRNPWDLRRTPGGSSGGAAAALAAGMVPVAHGNDGGGSLRIPAACCGLVGLKPQRGRASSSPDLGESLLSVDGVLSRTVADTAAILDLISGYEPGDANWAPPPAQPFAQARGDRELARGLRIAATTSSPLPAASVDPQAATAVGAAGELLQELGHDVREIEPPWRMEGLEDLFRTVFCTEVGLAIGRSAAVAGRPLEESDVEPMSWSIFQLARATGALEYRTAVVRLQAYARRLVATLEGFDLLLTPALAERPLPLGTLDTAAAQPMATFDRSGLFTPFTPVFNVTGQPAIALPLFQGTDGLPLAVQLVGRPAREDQLLALASQLEAALPWSARRPPAFAPAVPNM